MKIVESHFVNNPKRCQREAGKTHRQTNHADERLDFVLPQVAEGDFEIMKEHIFLVFNDL